MTLANIADGILASDHCKLVLESVDAVQNYAEAVGFDLSYAEAERMHAACLSYEASERGPNAFRDIVAGALD